jgi:hypothetical protein
VRVAAVIILAVVTLIASVCFANVIFGNKPFVLLLVTLAGNWSPTIDRDFSNVWNSTTGFLAILLNLGAIGLLLRGVISLVRQERRGLVNIANLYGIRDATLRDLVTRKVATELNIPPAEREKLREVINQAFVESENKWKEGTLVRVLGKDGAKAFAETVESEINAVQQA